MTDKCSPDVAQSQKCQRNVTFDIAKGIGILIIVLTHALGEMTLPKQFLCLFRVSIFFVISGYFFKQVYFENLINVKTFIKKRIKSLYLTYVITNSTFIILHNFLIKINFLTNNPLNCDMLGYTQIYDLFKIIKKILLTLIMFDFEVIVIPIWFIKVLFWISICFCIGSFILNKICKNDKIFELVRFLCIIFCLSLGFYFYKINFNYYLIGTMLSCSMPFYIGVLYKKYADNLKFNIYTLITTFVVLVICNHFNPKHFWTVHNYYNNPFWLIVTAISGFIFILSISKILSKYSILHKIFNYIGQSTLIILCLHFISYRLVNIIQVLYFNYPVTTLSTYPAYNPNNSIWWVAYLFAGIFFPCIIKEIYKNIKTLMEPKWK